MSTKLLRALTVAVLGPLAVAAVLLPFREHVSNTNVALVLVVAVVGVAVLGYRSAGALAALSAAAWFDFFFTRPYQRFTITRGADVATAALLLAVGLAVSQLAAQTRRLRVVAITDARYLEAVGSAARLAQRVHSTDEIAEFVRRELVGLLDLGACRFEYGSLIGRLPQLLPDGTAQRWEPGSAVELRVQAEGRYLGRFVLVPKGPLPPLQARLTAVTLAGQVGAAGVPT